MLNGWCLMLVIDVWVLTSNSIGVTRSKAPQTAAAMWQLIKLIAKKINMLIWRAEKQSWPTEIEKQKAKAETQNQLANNDK